MTPPDRPAQPAPDLDAAAVAAMIERLQASPNWMREKFGEHWKDARLTYDHAPFEAADMLRAMRDELAKWRCGQLSGPHEAELLEERTTLRAQLAERQHAADMATIHAELLEARVTALEAALRKIEAEDDQPECCGNGTTGTAYEPPECCNQPLYGIDRAKRIAAAALKGDPT